MFGEYRAEKVRHGLLGFTVGGACQGVRIDLDVGEPAAQGCGGARGEASRQRGFARAGGADKKNDAVYREVHLLQPCARREVEDGLGENPVLEARRQNDGVPDAVELRIRQATDVVDALLIG